MGITTDDIKAIDWEKARANSVIYFDLDADGLPINPAGGDLPEGRGQLRHWGEQPCADAIVIATLAGQQHLLLVERGDGHGWATPGGTIGDEEDPLEGALRELKEETGLDLSGQLGESWTVDEPIHVPDPRAGTRAWMVTWPCLINLGEVDELPAVVGADDARRAEWVPAGSYEQLVGGVAALGGRVFAAHEGLLGEVLG